MDLGKFTERSRGFLQAAQTIAMRENHQKLAPEHILKALMDDDQGQASTLIERAGGKPVRVVQALDLALGKIPVVTGDTGQIYMDTQTGKVLDEAQKLAKKAGDSFVPAERLLTALAIVKSPAKDAIDQGAVSAQTLNTAINDVRKGRTADSATAEDNYEALEKYAQDLTKAAEEGKIDPIIGRDDEIRRAMQVLSRRTKNNPVLIGEPGVGKTAIAEGLALRIINRDVPESLRDKQLLALDMGSLIAGAKYRGEFEDRLKRVIEEIEASEHLVVVIDEVHTLIGAGAAEGAMDAANTLKPALARGHFQCIGATTIEEYRQYIEKDKALERRFQPVYVNEPSVEETVEILKGLRQKYESYHNLTIEDSALMAAARMGSQYIADRYLPDKAIDLIDEASSRVRLLSYEIPEEAIELDRELRAMVFEKNEAVRLQNFELAIRLRNRENELRRQIATIIKAKKLQIDAAIEAEKVQAEKERLEKEQLADIPDPNLRNVVEEENKDKEILERFINPDPSDKKPDSDNMKSVTQSDFENDDEWEYQDELEPYIYNDDDNDLEDSMDEFKNFEKKTDENDKKESSEDSETKAQHSEKENILDEETFFNQYAERQLLISRDLFEEQLCKDDESDSNRVYDFDENGPGWEPLIEKSDDGDDTNYLDSFNDDDDDDFYKFNSFDRFINPFRR